ncbi:MAG: type II toxin-antitoxin system VapB family antitoxin [Oscillospiraceae bacterium]|jgi:Arc/MetJ family transcription regulator|nr:type II toxin-antitoxin system VapB family antitoxin [Oscillospiraceae bacterium]
MRTNIVIDDALMAAAMEISGLRTKREVVEKAMLEFVQKRSRKDLSQLKGAIQFEEGYDYKALRQGKTE